MSVPIRIELTVPLMADGKTVTELTIRRPKVRDLRVLEETTQGKSTQLDQSAVLVALLSGLSKEVVEDLDAADFARASEVIGGFFGEGRAPRTGAA
jgi:hypothetical protein